jgi:signal transduction histidine kinase
MTLPPALTDADTALLIFEAVRELLFNVVKHAATKRARVELGAGPRPGVLRVTVSDEGRGFGSATGGRHGSGFGLLSIRERLGYLGGALEVESSPGRGTRVILDVPCAGQGPAVAAAAEVGRAARVIGLSMHDDADMASTLLAAGAVAYLNKSGPAEKLVEAIRIAAGG